MGGVEALLIHTIGQDNRKGCHCYCLSVGVTPQVSESM